MRSPGAMMAVVNTPDNIPAANSCGYLQGVNAHDQPHSFSWTEALAMAEMPT